MVIIIVANPEPVAAHATLSTVISQLILSKRLSGRREKYLKGLELYLCQFARGRESMPISGITPDLIEEWFGGRKEAPSTRASNLGRLAALFTFARRRGLISVSPCEQIDRFRYDPKPPVILSPDEARRLLDVTREREPSLLGAIVLGLFAGIRPEELARLDWSAVDLDAARVTIDAAASKVRRRRFVPLEPAAVAWLRIADRSGPVLPKSSRRRRRRVVAAAGLCWHQDLLRHTAASYLLAVHGDAQRVAMGLGNSPGILLRHYRELVGVIDAARFWGLRPTLTPDGVWEVVEVPA